MDDWQQSSSKLELFVSIVEQLQQNGHKALVFSQFTKHLGIIKNKLDDLGLSYCYLDGGTPQFLRQQQVESFQAGHKDFFLISLKAGGTGITLTEADYVIHLDPWWNPAIEDQATDRAYRMGQTKPVTVYRLITKNSVEDTIVKLHQSKRSLAESILGDADQTASIDLEALQNLILSPQSAQRPQGSLDA